MMNILLLTDVYFPRVNGVSTSIRIFAESLQRLGHAVTIVAPDYGCHSGQEKHDPPGTYEVIRVASRKIFFDPEDHLMRASGLRALLPKLLLRHWDVIHIHTPFSAHRFGVRLARFHGTPTVETYHTFFEEYVALYLPWLPTSMLRAFARWLSRRMCHEVDHLIVPSQQMVGVLASYGITTPHTVLPTGIDLEQFSGGSGLRFRRQHGIAAERPTLVTVSRLAREKNIAFLLRMLQRLVPAFPEVLFIVAGEGPDAGRLREMAVQLGLSDNVMFLGNLDRATELLDCYRAGDVFVFASPTETQGLVLIEAMATGVPIVSTAVMGTATVLTGALSALISEEDVDAFADAVARVLRSPGLRAEMSKASHQDAQRWSAQHWMQEAVGLYARLAAGKKQIDPENPCPALPV